jgi:hypothetical protein
MKILQSLRQLCYHRTAQYPEQISINETPFKQAFVNRKCLPECFYDLPRSDCQSRRAIHLNWALFALHNSGHLGWMGDECHANPSTFEVVTVR